MATLDTLKRSFRQKAAETVSSTASSAQKLSDSQYRAGFDVLMRDQGYQEFIIPQLSLLLAPLLGSRPAMSILEVGPGPRSVLGHLPRYLRQKIRRYAAFEPNNLFASQLQEWLCASLETEAPLPYLEEPPAITRAPFVPNNVTGTGGSNFVEGGAEKFDVVLFCHSLYGMKPKHEFIKCALNLIAQLPAGGLVVAFHRGETLDCDGMACYRTAIFPTGVIRVADDDEALDCFSRFITGYVMQDPELDKVIRSKWRKICRSLGRYEEAHPDQLSFDSPSIMVAFNQQAYSLPKLISEVPFVQEYNKIKNWEARSRHSASMVRPTDTRQVQQCIRWALDHRLSLTVLGGGHSGHCLWPYVVSVDMSAFDQVHILPATGDRKTFVSESAPLVVAGAGCKSGDVIRKTMEAGLTVPLGARPSIGAGLWLQGGIGHLARLHGLACDSVVGAVLVSAASSEVLCIGSVPSQHQPVGAVRQQDESDLMWALKGAGTNIGILVSITFMAYAAPTYLIRNWVNPLHDKLEARRKLKDFDELVAKKLSRQCSADAYLYWNEDKLHLGVTMFESSSNEFASERWDSAHTSTVEHADALLGPEKTTSLRTVNGSDLFETEMYMSEMHGGHGGGKTSAFKRCVFLKHIGAVKIADLGVHQTDTNKQFVCLIT